MSGTKKIIYIVLIIIAIGFAFYYFSNNSDTSSTFGSLQVTTAQDMSNLTSEIKIKLRNIDQINLSRTRIDADIFQNPINSSLVDHSTTIIDEPTGRVNPFLPYITTFTTPTSPSATTTSDDNN
ncbi:MAG TPA: hypothetical protein PJ997_02435 [Candidatus Paceibacterota bacterium]|nr:hypothetical protein [Candidatus Paceibacterota bacterium]HMP19170.1 hypothetical protein [Candidatus Paceibacterota bacterium]HMP85221.1 hypothetical protein [Candidatus Paceibacterota bacterium]